MVTIVTAWTRRDQTLEVRRAEMSVLGLCGQAVAITRGNAAPRHGQPDTWGNRPPQATLPGSSPGVHPTSSGRSPGAATMGAPVR
jgi:hypothetical protein